MRLSINLEAGSILFAGMMLPGNAKRPVPFAFPVFGSKMHPATGVTLQFVPAGIADEKLALPLASKMSGLVNGAHSTGRELTSPRKFQVSKEEQFVLTTPDSGNAFTKPW